MKRLIALTLLFLLVFAGCETVTPPLDQPQTNGDNTMPEEPNSGFSGNADLPKEETPSTPSDAPEESTPSSPPSPLTVYLGEEHKDTSQVILVTVESYTCTTCRIRTFEKAENQWSSLLETSGLIGSKGSVPGPQRIQSTNKTPLGIYRITDAFGLSPDPGCTFPYTQITESMYWDLNSDSPTYNRLVFQDPGGDREILSQMGSQYDFILNTSYNYEQTPNKGGAIFIHVSNGKTTAGCVSMPREDMEAIIKWVSPSSNPVVIICLAADAPI